MTNQDEELARTPSGLTGTLKLLGIVALVLLAGLAILLVLDVIPREAFEDLAVKIALVTGIVGAATCAIGLLIRS
jgi:hypothetical protein